MHSAFFNNITYTRPKVPTLYTALTAGELATNPAVYSEYSHPFVLERGEVVDIIVNNLDSGKHPFHLHGHHFQSIWRSEDGAGTFQDSNTTSDSFARVPMRRDTIVLHPEGNVVLRFRADNPGVWYHIPSQLPMLMMFVLGVWVFHCHLEWHVQSGLMATFVEAPLDLQKTLKIPEDHYAACAANGVPTAGNAAGNTADLLDLRGQNAPPDPLPSGYVFSHHCVTAWCSF